MRYTTLDTAAIAVVAIVTAVQFLRARDNFSQVLYDAVVLSLAAFGANHLWPHVRSLVGFSPAISFLSCFVVMGALGIVLAVLVNTRLAFGMGVFNYVLGLLFAVVCAFAVGHATMRTFEFGFVAKDPELRQAMARSWVARELIYLRTSKEILVALRFARYKDL